MLVKAAVIQQSGFADPHQALRVTEQHLAAAAKQGVQCVLLPELFSHLYFCQIEDERHFALAQTIPGPLTDWLSKMAKQYNLVLIGSIFEKRAAGIYHNTAIVFEADGSYLGCYRKMHIPDDPGFYEKYYFTPGDLGFSPIDTSIGKLGVLVCWDQWFPEAARLMALAGAQILCYPTAIGWAPADSHEVKDRHLDAWVTIQRGHAIANHLPLLSANRIGVEDWSDNPTHFWGNSFICGPEGELLARADDKQTGFISAELDLAKTEALRQIWPYLRDRRIDAYQGLLQRYLAKD